MLINFSLNVQRNNGDEKPGQKKKVSKDRKYGFLNTLDKFTKMSNKELGGIRVTHSILRVILSKSIYGETASYSQLQINNS